MGITVTLSHPASPFYAGSSVSASTPRPYPLAINGRGYIPDFKFEPYRREAFRHRSIAKMRNTSDMSNLPGQQSLNPDGLWRRSQETWHGGAGQSHLDRVTNSQNTSSDETRFRTSKGVDVWTQWQLSLLPDTIAGRSSANTNLALATAGSVPYLIDGQTLLFAALASFASPTTVTGTPAATATSICSDGYNVYVAYTASGLYTTTRSAAAATQLVSTALSSNSICRYVKGRLLVSKDNAIYNVTSTSVAALPTALLTQPNTDFRWVDCAEGPANIYMAGYSGDKSIIYRTAVKADGTALDVPQVAGELPDGEIVASMQGYLGFLLIGSSLGVRFAQVDSTGDLLVGDLIPTTSTVRCFEPQDRFVWYGLTNYDATSTGLGRIDLRTLNGSAPAYASDLMATTQGAVTSVVTMPVVGLVPATYGRLFAVSGVGLFYETSTRVASGTLDSGLISFGVVDPKVAAFLHLDFVQLYGDISAYLSIDDGSFDLVGSATMDGTTSIDFPTVQTLTDHFEVRLKLLADSSATTGGGGTVILSDNGLVSSFDGPILNRYTLRANIAAATGFDIIVPVRFHEEMLVGGVEIPLVPSVELNLLNELRSTKRIVLYQEGNASYTVTVEDLDWTPESLGRDFGELNGVCTVSLKTLS